MYVTRCHRRHIDPLTWPLPLLLAAVLVVAALVLYVVVRDAKDCGVVSSPHALEATVSVPVYAARDEATRIDGAYLQPGETVQAVEACDDWLELEDDRWGHRTVYVRDDRLEPVGTTP